MSDSHFGNGFDPEEHQDEKGDFETIPAGMYEAVITSAKWENTKAGDGEKLKLTIEILSGKYKGRLLWDNLNLVNKSPKAVKIAEATLARICKAIEVKRLQTADQLENLPLMIKIGHEDYQGEPQARVKRYTARPKTTPAPSASASGEPASPAWLGK